MKNHKSPKLFELKTYYTHQNHSFSSYNSQTLPLHTKPQMGDRGRDERDRDRNRDRDRRRELDDRDRHRDRRSRHARSRSRSPDRRRRSRSETGSPSRSRSRSVDRSRRHHNHHSRRRERDEYDDGYDYDDKNSERKVVSDFVDGIAKEQKKKKHNNKGEKKDERDKNSNLNGEEGGEDDEIEMMKKLGIPVGFDSTKGKPVPGADVSGVRAVTKRQPRQYMNRRGGFNRPLPAELNR